VPFHEIAGVEKFMILINREYFELSFVSEIAQKVSNRTLCFEFPVLFHEFAGIDKFTILLSGRYV